jgi:hypothetical protein
MDERDDDMFVELEERDKQQGILLRAMEHEFEREKELERLELLLLLLTTNDDDDGTLLPKTTTLKNATPTSDGTMTLDSSPKGVSTCSISCSSLKHEDLFGEYRV